MKIHFDNTASQQAQNDLMTFRVIVFALHVIKLQNVWNQLSIYFGTK